MANGRLQSLVTVFVLFVVTLSFLSVMTSCSSKESKAKKAIEDYFAGQGAKDIAVDVFYTDPNFPDKAYVGATVTYNFASSGGQPQREFAGFILTREGTGWRVEKNTRYTKEQQQAAIYLRGGK